MLIAVQKDPIRVFHNIEDTGQKEIGDCSERFYRKIDDTMIPTVSDRYLKWEDNNQETGALLAMTPDEKASADVNSLSQFKIQTKARIRAAEVQKVKAQFPGVVESALFLGVYPAPLVSAVKQFAQTRYDIVLSKHARIDNAVTIDEVLSIETEVI